jgi:hypothetical protein
VKSDYVTAMEKRQPDAKNIRRAEVMIGFAETTARQLGGGHMKKTLLGLVIVASIFLAGCPVSDLHPLNNSSDNVVEPLLVGKWIFPNTDDKGSASFEKASGNGYTMILDDPESGLTDRYDVQLVRLGGNLFADLRFSSRSHGGTNADMPFGVVATHVVAKLTIAKDDLGWATMEDEALKNILKKDATLDKSAVGNLTYDSDNSLVLGDTETLRRYVSAHAKDGFSDGDHLKRAK